MIFSSIAIGMLGTIGSIFGSFEALETAENAGIGGVGDSIRNALLFSAGGIVGAVVGTSMLIFGRTKRKSGGEGI